MMQMSIPSRPEAPKASSYESPFAVPAMRDRDDSILRRTENPLFVAAAYGSPESSTAVVNRAPHGTTSPAIVEDSVKRSRDPTCLEEESVVFNRSRIEATTADQDVNQVGCKRMRAAQYVRPLEIPKNLLSAMGTLAPPRPNLSNSIRMEHQQVHTRRRLSGGTIEAFLSDQHKTDAMDTESSNTFFGGRPRSMSF